MSAVSAHVFSLARYTYCHLSTLRHGNGSPVVRLYADTEYDDPATQGGIVTFNLLRPDGEFYGSTEVCPALISFSRVTGWASHHVRNSDCS